MRAADQAIGAGVSGMDGGRIGELANEPGCEQLRDAGNGFEGERLIGGDLRNSP